MKKYLKLISVSLLILIMASTCGCVSSKFESVQPPVKAYPTAKPYEEVEVIKSEFAYERVLRGNKKGSYLVSNTTASLAPDFKVGDVGYVKYEVGSKVVKIPAKLTSVPSGNSGQFIVTYDTSLENPVVSQSTPGSFCVVLYSNPEAILVPKNCVWLMEKGKGYVHKKDENGVLSEIQIELGYSNDEYYEVVSGLNAGDKVVCK